MAGEIQKLFNTYEQKHMTLNRDAIVDLMLDDGVITYDIAQKIKSGVSLFLLDNEGLKLPQKAVSLTEILGGDFSRAKPKTNFNRQIEPTFQTKKQGDCWLLSDINALNCTDWGKKAIHDAIIPDNNGSGGVTINFKGSPLKQKKIHITAQEIDKARKSENYAAGDDDMIAFELATEKTFRQMVKQGLATRAVDDASIKTGGGEYRSYIWAGVKTKEFNQYPISELLGIKAEMAAFTSINNQSTSIETKEKIFQWLEKNKKDVSVVCGFDILMGGYGDKKSKNYIHGGHAYAIKSLKAGKEVVLSDPFYSDYEIKIPWGTFIGFVGNTYFSFKDAKTEQNFQKILPKNFDQMVKKGNEDFEKKLAESRRQFKTKLDSMITARKKQQLAQQRISEQKDMEIVKKNKLRVSRNIQRALQTLQQARSENSIDKLYNPYQIFNKDTILAVLDKYPDIVLWLDKKTFGWGNGTTKKFLIGPIVDALTEKAREKRINSKIIAEFESKCYKELDATFYTDEKIIQKEVEQMVKLIKSK